MLWLHSWTIINRQAVVEKHTIVANMKNPNPMKRHLRSPLWHLLFLAALGLSAIASPATAAVSLKVGIEGGYSLLSTSSDVEDKFLSGGALGFHLQLHLGESWALFIEADWARFPEYQLLLNNQGLLTPPIQDLRLLSGAGGVLYKLDVMPITPWVGLGFAALSYGRTVIEEKQSFLDTAVRLDFGADFQTSPWFELGILLRSDVRLTGESPYSTHFDILARATFVWTLR